MPFALLRRRFVQYLALGVLVTALSAHVGSPDTWFQGQAGPYPVQVVIRLPGVVPGLGQIDVRTTDDDITRVTAQPMIFNAGPEGAPPPDEATRVPGQPRSWHAELWFMTQASFRVRIEVSGARGTGTVEVPVVAAALRQAPLAPWLGGVLLVAGGFLFVGAVTIVRAGATDALAEPGVMPSPSRAARIAPAFGTVVLVLMLWGAWSWWRAVEREYVEGLYRPVAATAAIDTADGARTLRFTVADSNWMVQRVGLRLVESPIIPDHGKLMHLFLIERDGAAGAGGFGHLHPLSSDSLTFRSALGRLGAGTYDVYADVVHETGLPQTLVAEVVVPPMRDGEPEPPADPDDAVFAGDAAGDRFPLDEGGTVTWDDRPAETRPGEDAGLRFTVRDADGQPARLAPYLGMAGHAVVQRSDGRIYIHLHPNGTVSMGAQEALAARQADDTLPGMVGRRISDRASAMLGAESHAEHGASMQRVYDGALRFPYAFPEPGEYRVWVQFRRAERDLIETAVFRVRVP